tara:strand:+ start:19128 stop:19448 length:321 start_codon:yes stop_codon:yes gene_type:complete
MAIYLDRYEKFRDNGTMKPIPGIKLASFSTDKNVVYKLGETRLDILSQKYYNNPYHGWLILLANPQYGGLEFSIKNREILRIPFPFNSAVERYLNAVENYKLLYGG